MNVSFLIDGFNLYHSIEDVEKHERIKAKWLDVKTLLHSYLIDMGKEARFNGIYYFTALRHHVQSEKPASILRHKRYIEALESTGIHVVYGEFKEKTIKCKGCKKEFTSYEEKKTDVAIACKLLELINQNHSDIYVVVSGDTDLIPAIELAKKINDTIKIFAIFPYRRHNDEVRKYVDRNFTIKPNRYKDSSFKSILKLKNGCEIAKPESW